MYCCMEQIYIICYWVIEMLDDNKLKMIQKNIPKLLETGEIMQRKAKDLIMKYSSEMGKRGRFTYNLGEKAKSVKASTSLKRAIEFYNECLKIIYYEQ